MKKPLLSSIALATTLALAGCNSTATNSNAVNETATQAAKAYPSVAINYDTFTLDNGLKVVVHTDKKAPIVAVNVWYKVGAKDEQLGKTGFAHLFEHLMFNGTENYDDEYFGPFERVGATEMNGTTNSDRTNYFQNVPTPALDLALWMESDRMGHLLGAVTQEKLDEQRGVVQNEKRQGEARPYGKMWGVIAEQSFPKGHPYSWSVIGSMEDLNAASLDDVHQWFKDYYGPNNAVLVLAGDIDVATAKEKVNKYFGDIKPGKPVATLGQWVAKRTGTKRYTMQDRVPAPYIRKVWNTAPMGTAEAEHLALLADILANGKNSRLYKRLVIDEKLSSTTSAFNYSRLLAGQTMVSADALDKANLAKIEAIIDEEMARLIAEGPTKDELHRIKFSNSANWVKRVEGVGGFGGKSDVLAAGMVYHDDPGFYQKQHEMMVNTTQADIQSAGQKWLTDGKLVMTILPFEKLAKHENGADRSKLPEVNELPQLNLPEVQTTTLSNGLEVVLATRSDTPTIQAALEFDSGFATDPKQKQGLANFTMAMLDEGTKELDALALEAKLEALGASLNANAAVDYATVSLNALSMNWEQSIGLLSDVIQAPRIAESDLERVRTSILEGIKQEEANPQSNAYRILPPLLYGEGHPYAAPLTGSGTTETVKNITRDDILGHVNTWMRPDNARMIVVGDIDMATLKASLEKQLASWQAPQSAKPEKAITEVADAQKTRVFIFDKPESPQSLIMAGVLGDALNELADEQEIKQNVMNTIIGGSFTSRMNMNLREDKGWSYGARTMLMTLEGQSPFVVYAPVQTDKTKESIAEILKELNGYINDKPATSAELEKVIANKVARVPGSYEKKRTLLSALASAYRKGESVDYLEQYPAKVQNVALGDVAKEAKHIIKPNAMTWVIVGDVAKIKAEVESLNLGDITYL